MDGGSQLSKETILNQGLTQVKIKKSDDLYNVSDDLIKLYLEDNYDYVESEIKVNLLESISTDYIPLSRALRWIVTLTLSDLGSRGVEGMKSVNEGGQSLVFMEKDKVVKDMKVYRLSSRGLYSGISE